MTPETVKIIQIGSIALPWMTLVVAELVRGSASTGARYYARFLIFGCGHALILWVVFVWSHHSGGMPRTWTDLAISLAIFLLGALAWVLTFSLAYLATAFALRYVGRFLRSLGR